MNSLKGRKAYSYLVNNYIQVCTYSLFWQVKDQHFSLYHSWKLSLTLHFNVAHLKNVPICAYGGVKGTLTQGIVLNAEIFPKSLLPILVPMAGIMASVGQAAFCAMAYFLPHWRHLQLAMALYPALVLPYYWYTSSYAFITNLNLIFTSAIKCDTVMNRSIRNSQSIFPCHVNCIKAERNNRYARNNIRYFFPSL